jgi:regulator of ribonuclease activity A
MKHTADICDSNEKLIDSGEIRILSSIFKPFGKKKFISGQILTLKAIEDNSLVRSTLELSGKGRVLVVDGAASQRCALLGGSLGKLAEENGWEGVIVYGCIRDSHELLKCNIGVWALSTHPKKSKKMGTGTVGQVVDIGGTRIFNEEFCLADGDGILISSISYDNLV